MNEKIKIETPLVIECHPTHKLFKTISRNLTLTHKFQFETENNPCWENNPNHYYERIKIKFKDCHIATLHKEEIDELIQFTDAIKAIRTKHNKVIKDRNYHKKNKKASKK